MKIGNPLELFRTGAPAGGAASPETDKARVPANPSQPAEVEGSAKVKLSGGLAKLKATANADGVFDAKRVEQLRASIFDGSFRVNAEVVADSVISSNLEALKRAKP